MNLQRTIPTARTCRSRKLKAWLLEQLGNHCAQCPSSEFLQFDLIHSDGGKHHALDYHTRLRFYVTQLRAGNLQALCPDCHVKKTLRDIAMSHLPPGVTCPCCGAVIPLSLSTT
jgi:hypothetical protein